MYTNFYKFNADPFRLSPNFRLCYRHPSFQKAKAYMQYALHRGEGFLVIAGLPGIGKTILIQDFVSSLTERRAIVANLASTRLKAHDLLQMVANGFGLEGRAETTAYLLQRLELFLQWARREGRRPLLIVDEAQDLHADAFQELRLLTNLSKDARPLLQIFYVGQEDLCEALEDPRLEQLRQHKIAVCHLEPLDLKQTEAYVRYRLVQVGWRNNPAIDQAVFSHVYQYSLGIPRWINLVCGRLLLHGMIERKNLLDSGDVRMVLKDLLDEHLMPTQIESER